jgi:hypothetical protein
MKAWLIVLVLLLTLTSGSAVPARGNATPAEVGDDLIAGLNERNASAISMLMADRFVAITPACIVAFGEGGCTTRSQFQTVLEATFEFQPQVSAGEAQVSGSDVRYDVEWRDLFSAQLGLERVLFSISLTVEADRITRLTIVLDRSDPQSAAYATALATALAAAQAPSMTPPSTGDGGLNAH